MTRKFPRLKDLVRSISTVITWQSISHTSSELVTFSDIISLSLYALLGIIKAEFWSFILETCSHHNIFSTIYYLYVKAELCPLFLSVGFDSLSCWCCDLYIMSLFCLFIYHPCSSNFICKKNYKDLHKLLGIEWGHNQ